MTTTPRKIGIVGAGYIGRALAQISVAAGHDVMISNSRGPETLASISMRTGAKAGTQAEAVAFGDLVAIAIPFANRHELDPAQFTGKIVMDANNYYEQRDGRIEALNNNETTTSQMMAEVLPGSRLVKAFNAILADDLATDGKPDVTERRRALPICGDDQDAKAQVAAYIESLGFDVYDAGPLSESWRIERAMPAYCRSLALAELRDAVESAERGKRLQEGSWRKA